MLAQPEPVAQETLSYFPISHLSPTILTPAWWMHRRKHSFCLDLHSLDVILDYSRLPGSKSRKSMSNEPRTETSMTVYLLFSSVLLSTQFPLFPIIPPWQTRCSPSQSYIIPTALLYLVRVFAAFYSMALIKVTSWLSTSPSMYSIASMTSSKSAANSMVKEA